MRRPWPHWGLSRHIKKKYDGKESVRVLHEPCTLTILATEYMAMITPVLEVVVLKQRPPPPLPPPPKHSPLIPLGSLVQQQDTIVFVSSVVPRQFLCVKTEGIIGRD